MSRILLLSLILNAGSIAAKVLVKAYYIAANGDTNRIILLMPKKLFKAEPKHIAMQMKVKYQDHFGKKAKLKPGMAREFGFEYNGINYRFLSLPFTWMLTGTQNIFLLLKEDGDCKLLSFFQRDRNFYFLYEHRVFLKPGSEPHISARGPLLVIGPSLSEYFSDCPLLSSKIKERAMTAAQPEEIVRYYNRACAD